VGVGGKEGGRIFAVGDSRGAGEGVSVGVTRRGGVRLVLG
jgi:hypothetical protein